MPAEMIVYVCESPAQAVTAKQFLINRGYSDSQVTTEQSDLFIYDAATYDGGKSDNLPKKIIVIGRK